MTDFSTAALICTLGASLCYLAASWQLFKIAQQPADQVDTAPSIPIWGLLGAVLHFATLAMHTEQNQGVSSSFFDALSITAFIVVSLGLLAQTRYTLRALLIPIFLIAVICLLLASLADHHTPIVADSPGMLTHILSSIIAYSLLSLATVQAIALQRMEQQLKSHHDKQWIRQLPPLQTMESVLFQLIGLGWLALSIGIVSGILFIDDLFAQHLVHKTVFSILSWLLFGLLIVGRQRYGWRGATAVKWTLSAFVALLLAYFGSKFVLEILLGLD